MDFMSSFSVCESAPPEVINMSLGSKGTGQTGTDSQSRKLDDKVWTYGQAYVVSAGNGGPGPQTIGSPAVAKNALTVGNVFDRRYLGVGDIANSQPGADRGRPHEAESRGPRQHRHLCGGGDHEHLHRHERHQHGRPPRHRARGHAHGALPRVQGAPGTSESHLMATAIAHDDVTGKSNDYGLGRVSGYLAHWAHPNNDGWSTHWFYGGVNGGFGFAYGDITVPANTQRMVVVLTWDEPAASAGASRAVTYYDLDLWADHTPTARRRRMRRVCLALRRRQRRVPRRQQPAGRHFRLKVVPVNAPTFPLRYGMAAMIIRGDPTPAMTASLTAPAAPPLVGAIFEVQMSVSTHSYVASGVQVPPTVPPRGDADHRPDEAPRRGVHALPHQ